MLKNFEKKSLYVKKKLTLNKEIKDCCEVNLYKVFVVYMKVYFNFKNFCTKILIKLQI